MIVEMIRYDFLLYHKDVSEFLERLRELGLVDVTLSDFSPSDEEKSKIELSEGYKRVAREMGSIAAQGVPYDTVPQAVDAYSSAVDEIAKLEVAIIRARVEVEQSRVWGDFDARAIDKLKDAGLVLRFFETTSKAFGLEWEHIYPIEVIERAASKVYFVVVVPIEDRAKFIDINAIELPAPLSSWSQREVEIEDFTARQDLLRVDMARAAMSREQIKEQGRLLNDEIEFIKVENSGETEVDGTLKILEGWSAKSDRASIEEFASVQDVLFFAEKPTLEHNPPIKLKNNFFARLYEPIGALYMMPRYNELDLTPFFAPFFMIFFGMCFADAGYGLLFILAVIVFWRKIPAKSKGFGWLALFLNFSAVIFGILTGNFFGIELVMVDALVEFKEFFLSPNDVFYLSLCLGAIQIVFGMIIKIFNRTKRGGSFVYGLSSVGWLVLVVSSIVALGLSPESYTSDSIAYQVTMGGAIALILFFTVPYKPFASIGLGLYSFYENITGMVGDLISYVRLFAIGLAGTVIAQVFNELAVGLSGDIPVVSFLVMVAILLVGHGMNIFISVLGSVVHPIRLTFVEFYKNADFEGGGRRFTPFKREVKS